MSWLITPNSQATRSAAQGIVNRILITKIKRFYAFASLVTHER